VGSNLFSILEFCVCPSLFHSLEGDGGSGGRFGADAIEGGAGDASDRAGKNSGGIKVAHTS
jgi:hypothetical protein